MEGHKVTIEKRLDQNVYKIDVLAKALGIGESTLRDWITIGKKRADGRVITLRAPIGINGRREVYRDDVIAFYREINEEVT